MVARQKEGRLKYITRRKKIGLSAVRQNPKFRDRLEMIDPDVINFEKEVRQISADAAPAYQRISLRSRVLSFSTRID